MQADTRLPIAPPLSGADLVTKLNAIIETLGTDFAGPDDPAAIAWAYATWADTGNLLLKRRNAANSAWVAESRLLDLSARQVGDPAQRFRVAASAAADEAVAQSQVFGLAQSNTSVARTTSTIYTNSTSKPIRVMARGTSTGTAGSFLGVYVRIGASNVPAAMSWAHRDSVQVAANAMIMPGESYTYEQSNVIAIAYWETL